MSFFPFFFFSAPKPKFWLRFINFESCRLPSSHPEKKFITSCRDFCKHVVISLGPFSFKEAVIILLMSVAEKLSLDADASTATCFVFFLYSVESKCHLAHKDYEHKVLAEQIVSCKVYIGDEQLPTAGGDVEGKSLQRTFQ